MHKKRPKNSRHRGTHTHGRGAKKKARGSGHRGGIGMSGTGKRSDQKKTLVLKKYGNKYFGRDKVRGAAAKKDVKTITVQQLIDNIQSFVKQDIAKGSKGAYTVDLKAHKIIGKGDLDMKLTINALAATRGAQESVKKAGGEIILVSGKKKTTLKVEKKNDEEAASKEQA